MGKFILGFIIGYIASFVILTLLRAIIEAFFNPKPYLASTPVRGNNIPILKLLLSEIPISAISVL